MSSRNLLVLASLAFAACADLPIPAPSAPGVQQYPSRATAWRARALRYGMSPDARGGWSVFDYFLSSPPAGWRVVGRVTVLHAD